MDLNLKKYQENLLFTPLGGASEIGMNVNLYHLDGKWLMVDLGLGFAHDILGIDMLAPDISFIKAHKNNLIGLILTHIHEDHLGAVQYLWEELKMPIYTSKLTANFLRAKLEEYPFAKQVKIIEIDQKKQLSLKPFTIEFIGLTHSVPEMNALLVKTRYGNILHSGDWKFDPDPVVGNVSQKETIKSYGDKGEILALVCDSTNATSKGHSGSEGDLHESLKEIIQKCQKRVAVATFASNLARIQTISQVAKECGRKVVLAGFSVRRLMEVGKKSGYFQDLPEFISDQEINLYKPDEVLVIATGCQGEPLAATMKIATDNHRYIKFGKDDTIIFSSKIIPGNEKPIFELFDLLAKKQIKVITEKDHFVHVSGHPNQDELKEMYQLARPQIAIPVHGQFSHIRQHCQIAQECGTKDVIEVSNGTVVKLDKDDPKIVGFVPTGYFGVDGKQLIPINGEIIKARRRIANSGIITVAIIIDDNGNLLGQPKILSLGAYDFAKDPMSLDMLETEVVSLINSTKKDLGLHKKKGGLFKKKQKGKQISADKIKNTMQQSLRALLNKFFKDILGKKPVVQIIIEII